MTSEPSHSLFDRSTPTANHPPTPGCKVFTSPKCGQCQPNNRQSSSPCILPMTSTLAWRRTRLPRLSSQNGDLAQSRDQTPPLNHQPSHTPCGCFTTPSECHRKPPPSNLLTSPNSSRFCSPVNGLDCSCAAACGTNPTRQRCHARIDQFDPF